MTEAPSSPRPGPGSSDPPAAPGGGERPPGRGNTLGLRLALAFLGVALAAVALIAALTAVFSAADVSSLASRQRTELAGAFAVTAGSSWQHQGWVAADLAPLIDVAEQTGVQLQVRDAGGRTVRATAGFTAAEATASEPVVVSGHQVGSVLVGLTGSGLGAADAVLRTALLRAIAGAAGLAALLALVTGLAVSRRITRPVARLISVTRAMAGGDRSSRAGEIKAPAELRELAAAFDNMADTLDREDKIRRDLVASVAHELRTPVAVLQAGHEALLDGITEPDPEELGSLRDEVLRLARMVDDLQTMAAADAAVLQLTRERQDLADIARSAGRQLGPQVRGGGGRARPRAGRGAGARRRAVDAPGGDQPAWQRAQVHPGRRHCHHQHWHHQHQDDPDRAGRPDRGARGRR